MVKVNREYGDQLDPGITRIFTSPQPITNGEWASPHLTLDNDGTTVDMTVLGTAGSPARFQYIVPEGKVFFLSRMIFTCADVSIEYLDWFGFGATLPNGVIMRAVDADDNVLNQFMHPLKDTIEFAHLAGGDIPLLRTEVGVKPDILVVRWSLFKTGFVPLLAEGDKLEVVIQDDLQPMVHFEAVAQGRECDA